MAGLTILSVAYPFAALDVDSSGGAEQVLSILDEALVQSGHRSIVVAREDSLVHGELAPIPCQSEPLDAAAIGRAHAAIQCTVAKVLSREHVDVIHVHGLDFDRYFPPEGAPLLATLHLPPSWYSREALAPTRPQPYLACVSEAQRATLPPWASEAAVVENGIHVDRFTVANERGDYCLMLARLCPEKGIHEALAAATQA
ncbi:MAG TPA: glycosyltransferase, partial [Polyangiaceae bacterium]